MTDRPWKRFERDAAAAIGGKRFWANAGEAIDAESEHFVLQCKHVKAMSLAALTQLASQVHAQGQARGKVGLVAIKHRSGKGKKTPMLLVMHEDALPLLLQGPGSISGNDVGSGTGVPKTRQSAAPGSDSVGTHRPPKDVDVPASARCGGKPESDGDNRPDIAGGSATDLSHHVGAEGARPTALPSGRRVACKAASPDIGPQPTCERCKGKGYVWQRIVDREIEQDVCPDCDGGHDSES